MSHFKTVRDLRQATRYPDRWTVCLACDSHVPLADMAGGLCQKCEDERHRAYNELRPDGTPKAPPLRDEMQDGPFLPEDE